MNVLNTIMNYENSNKLNIDGTEKVCNCVKCTNNKIKYPSLSEEEIETLIKKRYLDKDEKTKKFIRKSLRIHGDRYDYSNVIYIKSDIKVEIICRVEGHKPFPQTPHNHLRGHGCSECGGNKKLTTKKFIDEANKIHGIGTYDYSKVEYVDYHTDVIIICPIHGEFPQTPANHLKGCGCLICSNDYVGNCKRLTLKEFVENSNEIHGEGTYDYSKVNYVNNQTEVIIVCPIHGEFPQTPANHLNGKGCKLCGIKKQANNHKLTKEEFIKRSNEVHGEGAYDYSKVEYVDMKTDVIIVCPKHGDFPQTPNSHIYSRAGCPKCKNNYKGEIAVRNFLIKNGIEFVEQKKFNDCKDLKALPFDFYVPKYNLCIEFDGVQHFKPYGFSKNITEEEKIKNFEYVRNHDNIKHEYCKKNGIALLRLNHLKTVEEKLSEYF